MALLSWYWLALGIAIVFAAGVVRGLSGFGFSAVCVAGLSLFVPPAQVVPPVFILEVFASLSMLRGALRHVDWRWLSWLVLGNFICIPIGVALLAVVPETPLRLLIGSLLLVAAALLRSGFRFALQPTARVRLATGLVSGFIGGVAAIGGIVVALLLSTAQMPAAAMRATMVILLLLVDLYALAWAGIMSAGVDAGTPLLNADTLHTALWMTPAMLLGIWLGSRAFAVMSAEQFRRQVLNLLVLIASVSVLRALFVLWLA
jgi:uncharacterized membrane protein YfcA